jgi:lipoprotein signal peptidase
MYDRIFNGGRVIDSIQFDFWQSFPIFNIADCAIVIGCAVLILYFILDAVKPSEKEEKAE